MTADEITHQILNLDAGILRPTAVLGEGGEALEGGVAYKVYAGAQDAEGNRKLVTESNQYLPPPRFALPAGRYVVTAEHGSASANAEVEVTPAGLTQQVLNLRAGIILLTAVTNDGSETLAGGVAYKVYTAARDAEGNRKLVTESNQYAPPPRFPVPAGRYFVTAQYGSASASAEIEVAPANVTREALNLRAGILRLTAVLSGGSEALEGGVAYRVYTTARDAEGNRKLVTESNQYAPPPRFPLPAGNYFVTATHSTGSASAETTVAAGGVHDVQLRLAPTTMTVAGCLADVRMVHQSTAATRGARLRIWRIASTHCVTTRQALQVDRTETRLVGLMTEYPANSVERLHSHEYMVTKWLSIIKDSHPHLNRPLTALLSGEQSALANHYLKREDFKTARAILAGPPPESSTVAAGEVPVECPRSAISAEGDHSTRERPSRSPVPRHG